MKTMLTHAKRLLQGVCIAAFCIAIWTPLRGKDAPPATKMMRDDVMITATASASIMERFTTPSVHAAPACGADDPFCLDTTAVEGGVKPKDGDAPSLPVALGRIVRALLGFVGVLFFALMVWAGVRWMLARGNDEEVQKAKGTIEYAVIGLVVVIASYALITFVVETLFKPPAAPAPTSHQPCPGICEPACTGGRSALPGSWVCSTGLICCQ